MLLNLLLFGFQESHHNRYIHCLHLVHTSCPALAGTDDDVMNVSFCALIWQASHSSIYLSYFKPCLTFETFFHCFGGIYTTKRLIKNELNKESIAIERLPYTETPTIFCYVVQNRIKQCCRIVKCCY